jgi:hypothetical protein
MRLEPRVRMAYDPSPTSVVETIEGFLMRKTRLGKVASKWYARELAKVLRERFEFRIKKLDLYSKY